MIIELNRNTLGLYFAVEPRSLFDRLSENYAFIYLISEDLGEAPRRVASFDEVEPLLEAPITGGSTCCASLNRCSCLALGSDTADEAWASRCRS